MRPGRRVGISVSAVGAPPVSFQWLKDGAPVDGGTSRTLVLTNLTDSGSNSFSVLVSNGGTPVASDLAPVVTLSDPPAALTNGLVSYWPFDTVIETPAGTNTPDIYYDHTDFGLTNMDSSTAIVSGQFSNALTFAINQYGKRIGGTPIYSTTNYTISFWVQGGPGQANKMVFAEGGTNAAGANGDYFLLGTENPAGGGLLNVKSSASPVAERSEIEAGGFRRPLAPCGMGGRRRRGQTVCGRRGGRHGFHLLPLQPGAERDLRRRALPRFGQPLLLWVGG